MRPSIRHDRRCGWRLSNGCLIPRAGTWKDGRHVSLDAARPQVWQKEGGTWKIAAMFMHRYFEQWKPLNA